MGNIGSDLGLNSLNRMTEEGKQEKRERWSETVR
jgi:hypothetical protein